MSERIQWEPVARRGENHHLLVIDYVMQAYVKNLCGKTFGEHVEFIPSHYRQFDGARWFGKDDVERYVSLLKHARRTRALLKIGEAYEERANETKRFAEKIAEREFERASHAELAEAFGEFSETSTRLWAFAYHYIMLNRFLPEEVTAEVTKRVKDSRQLNEFVQTLIGTDKASQIRQENIALFALAEQFMGGSPSLDSPEGRTLIESHRKRFAHLGRYYFRSAPYTPEQLRERILHLTKEDIEKKKREFAEQARIPQRTKEIIDELSLSEQTVADVYSLKQFAFDSNYSDEIYNYLVSSSTPMLNRICSVFDCSWNELTSMTSHEISLALAHGTPLPGQAKSAYSQRHADHAIILSNGSESVLEGKALEAYRATEERTEENFHHLTELKGLGASPGKATGAVALVSKTSELSKVRKGDILVTAMTTPEFVPAMERAAAIVTDDGGMLCHAAIVSRELRVPCLVGTKVATKALRTGDVVEVDAGKGMLRVVSRA